jgi:hypothetical protein
VPEAGGAVVASVVAACLAEAALMAKESGMGWQLGISGEQAMAGLAEYARLIRAEANQVLPSDYNLTRPNSGVPKSHAEPAGFLEFSRAPSAEEIEQFRSRWNEDRNAFRVTELYSGPTTVTPYPVIRYEVPPVEAFAECPACHIQHYPLITGIGSADTFTNPPVTFTYVLRECQHCQHAWRQQEPA